MTARLDPLLKRGVLFALAMLLYAQQNGFEIVGTVIDSETKQPLGKIRVSLARNSNQNKQIDMITAADGRFRFWGLVAGKYTLQAQGLRPSRKATWRISKDFQPQLP